MYRQAQQYSYAGNPEDLESGIIAATGTGERGEEGGEGGDDNDLVSRGQHDQSSAPQRVRRAELVSRERVRGGREGEEGGGGNDLLLRGKHDHIQSPAPQRAYKRLGWRLLHSLLEVVSCAQSRGRGRGEGRAGRLQASDPSRLCTQREGGVGEGGGGEGGLGRAGRLQASDPRKAPRKASGQLLPGFRVRVSFLRCTHSPKLAHALAS